MNSIPSTSRSQLSALRLSEERACAGYLTARRAMVAAGARAVSLGRLLAEHPNRADYRQAWLSALTAHTDDAARTQSAWLAWQCAQHRTDAAWTDSAGRAPHTTAA